MDRTRKKVLQELASVDLAERSNDPPPPLQQYETTDFAVTGHVHNTIGFQISSCPFCFRHLGLFTSVSDVIQQQPSGMVGQEVPPY